MSQSRAVLKLADTVRDLQRALQEIAGPYRPELHYMRGPGPKWREKHVPGTVASEAEDRLPAMVKVRG